MADPTLLVRGQTYGRDLMRCVVCGSPNVTFGHRRAVGAGGSKIRPECVDAVTQCLRHNEAAEADGQTLALYRGWKVRRWVQDPGRVPMYYPLEAGWFRLVDDHRVPITEYQAEWMMREVYGEEWLAWGSATL